MLERYGHGGDLQTAAEMYGKPASGFLDFSSNMNPFGPPESVGRVLAAYASVIGSYPDPASRKLRRKLARLHDIDEQSILIGNGAAELIDLVVRWLRPSVTGLACPSFGEYGDAVRKIGGEVAPIMLRAEQSFQLDEEALQQSFAAGADFFLLGSPNNPTGRRIDPAIVRTLLNRGADVALDEAFIDFIPDADHYSFIREAAKSDKLFVIRSMTKFYAVPGIRLGYIVGSPERIAALKQLQVPWSVNSLAQSIGEAVLDEHAYAEKTLNWLQEERSRLASRLDGLGFRVFPSETNYVLAQLPPGQGVTASALQRAMGKKGVLIRDASHFTGLDESYCRFAVKLRHDNDTLCETLSACLAELSDPAGREVY
ncbi:threonine-phosphate decarboxylase CobD [Paenibacillus sp. NPDC058071]|uniref:threonine-phosphate decarboxylase CobD n=1 Tax=Paenibacillus sp. NPDC058071 TaxID=3346326 RepID=UPI0036D7B654